MASDVHWRQKPTLEPPLHLKPSISIELMQCMLSFQLFPCQFEFLNSSHSSHCWDAFVAMSRFFEKPTLHINAFQNGFSKSSFLA